MKDQEEEQWSTIVPNTSRDDRGDIRRSHDPLSHPELGYMGCQTLYEGFRRGQSMNPLGACMGFRAVSSNGLATPYIYSSYTECLARIDAFAAGLDTLNLVPPNEDNMVLIALYMNNCMEWVIAEQAIFALSGATVPMYDTLGPDAAQYIMAQTGTKTIVATRKQLQHLCTIKESGKCPRFDTVILVDGVTQQAVQEASKVSLELFSFAKVEAIGAQTIATIGHTQRPPSPKDIFTFCYTSGTTGTPKGALLTHQNLISAVAGASSAFAIVLYDRHLSYLPLAHIFERICMAQAFIGGASVAFYRGDPLLLIDDMKACRPTILPVAPRVLNKIYDKIHVGIAAAGGMKKKLFDAAVATKTYNLMTHGELKHGFYDRLIFNKIKAGLGMDHLRLMVSGSAPLSRKVMIFYRCLLGIPVVEGYGQTEGSAAECISSTDDMKSCGHVGCPTPSCEIVLVDVPEMGYRHTDTDHKGQPCQGRGEIWVRGPTIFKGYYKEEEKTKETIDADGWLHSGDIGLWTTQGQLQIIDRKKNIFKLSQGEYVAPEKIENVMVQSLYIAQAFVYGDSLQSSLVAVIIPDEEPLRNFLSSSQKDASVVFDSATSSSSSSSSSFASLCQPPKGSKEERFLHSFFLEEIKRVSKENGLHGFEIPRAIYIDSELFSAENGILTPTFKLKRVQAREKYEQAIEQMYATMPPPSSKL